MKRTLLYGIIFPLVGGFLLTTCQKNFDPDRLSDEIEIQPQLVAPLLYGSMTMSDITELFDTVEYIGEFEDGLIYLAYSDTLVSVSAEEDVDLPDLETTEFYLESDTDIPIMLPVPVDDTFFLDTRSRLINFQLQGDDRLDHILIKDGFVSIDLESTFLHEGVLTVSSQQIRDQFGQPFSNTLYIDDPSGGFMTTVSVPSDSFLLDPITRNDSNLIYFDFDLALINSGNPISLGEHCVVQAGLIDASFYSVFGFIDTRDLIDESGHMEIPFWADNPDLASIVFADPRIEITTTNSFGIPFDVEFDSVIATGIDSSQVTLTLYDGNILKFLAPGMDRIGDTVTTNISIDNITSNIQEFMAVAPSSISYRVAGRTSTTNEDTTHFIIDESQLDLHLEFLLPLDFKSTGFALTDTMEFVIAEDGIDTSMVKNAEITVTTINKLPIELMLQVFLLDSNHVVVDSVFDDNVPILGASLVDNNGITTEGVEEINTVEFPAEKLGKLEEVSYMQVRARMITSNQGGQFVKVMSYYTLDFKISMLANFRINTRKL
jgi:hypothetical protein